MAFPASNVYGNILPATQNPNTNVYLLNGRVGSFPQESLMYQSSSVPYVSTLPAGGVSVQTIPATSNLSSTAQQPQVQVYQVSRQPGNEAFAYGQTGIQVVGGAAVNPVSSSTCPCSSASGGQVVTKLNTDRKYIPQVSTTPAARYVPLTNPNAVQGWNSFINSSNQPDEFLVEEHTVFKARAAKSGQANVYGVRMIGVVLTLLGSLTVGLGIAAVILYHVGRETNSGLSWCFEAHNASNNLTKALIASSPAFNYVTSGAGILGIMIFVVGVMSMNLVGLRGPMSVSIVYTSCFTLPILILVAVLSLLSTSMTFGPHGEPPTCIPLTVITAVVAFLAVLAFILIFVQYCMMQTPQQSTSTSTSTSATATGGQDPRLTPLSKISVIKVGASAGSNACACECCPWCVPATTCCPYAGDDDVEIKNTDKTEDKTTVAQSPLQPQPNAAGCSGQPVMRYPYAHPQHIWGQVAPYRVYGKAVYTPYNSPM